MWKRALSSMGYSEKAQKANAEHEQGDGTSCDSSGATLLTKKGLGHMGEASSSGWGPELTEQELETIRGRVGEMARSAREDLKWGVVDSGTRQVRAT
jgi:hypothetical protein